MMMTTRGGVKMDKTARVGPSSTIEIILLQAPSKQFDSQQALFYPPNAMDSVPTFVNFFF